MPALGTVQKCLPTILTLLWAVGRSAAASWNLMGTGTLPHLMHQPLTVISLDVTMVFPALYWVTLYIKLWRLLSHLIWGIGMTTLLCGLSLLTPLPLNFLLFIRIFWIPGSFAMVIRYATFLQRASSQAYLLWWKLLICNKSLCFKSFKLFCLSCSYHDMGIHNSWIIIKGPQRIL